MACRTRRSPRPAGCRSLVADPWSHRVEGCISRRSGWPIWAERRASSSTRRSPDQAWCSCGWRSKGEVLHPGSGDREGSAESKTRDLLATPSAGNSKRRAGSHEPAASCQQLVALKVHPGASSSLSGRCLAPQAQRQPPEGASAWSDWARASRKERHPEMRLEPGARAGAWSQNLPLGIEGARGLCRRLRYVAHSDAPDALHRASRTPG